LYVVSFPFNSAVTLEEVYVTKEYVAGEYEAIFNVSAEDVTSVTLNQRVSHT
jgi:hypothetical protein